MDRITTIPKLDDWIPIRLYWREGEPTVDWCYFGKEQFVDPFFTETIERRLQHPVDLLFRHQTSIEVLRLRNELRPGLSPNGFIFHTSRCGSTLISQMLTAQRTNIVISEAGVINTVIRAGFRDARVTEDVRVNWLRWLMSALGQPRLGEERKFFVKFDAWNVIDLPLIRRAFPDVPWIFVYRDPVEVLVSQFNHRGANMIPGAIEPVLFGMDLNTAVAFTPEEYCAKVLDAICEAAIQNLPTGGMLINYSELPDVFWDKLLKYFGIAAGEDELNRIKDVARRNAKDPAALFSEDREEKRKKATPAMREAAERWCYPLYERLEALRRP